MFVDDDVELAPGTIVRLLAGLRADPRYAALAADYRARAEDHPTHVAMGATLFRRSALALIRFRWAPGRCECQCCCDDLRRHTLGISYVPGVRAWHHRILPPLARGGQGGSRRDVMPERSRADAIPSQANIEHRTSNIESKNLSFPVRSS